MNPELQRIKIAEACGYIRNDELDCWEKSNRYYFSCGDSQLAQLPDYLNDLNAMHHAEKVIGPIKVIEFCCHLNEMGMSGEWEILTATAAQRAEAFLRTLNLWEE
jgi:hypothetical protein